MATKRVHFRNAWFAPSAAVRPNNMQVMSGRRFRPGVHDVPEALLKFLPKSAQIVDDDFDPDAPVVEESLPDDYGPHPNADLRAHDVDRTSGEIEAKLLAEANAAQDAAQNEQTPAQKRAAAARAAKAAKKAEAEGQPEAGKAEDQVENEQGANDEFEEF